MVERVNEKFLRQYINKNEMWSNFITGHQTTNAIFILRMLLDN